MADTGAPVLIDEWQLGLAVWDRLRKAVDEDARRFLLAGSAVVAPGGRIPLRRGPDRQPRDAPALDRRARPRRTAVSHARIQQVLSALKQAHPIG